MYIYFDYSGNLKEIVSYPVRQGDDNSKTIYVYVESSANPQMSDDMYKLPANITAASIAFKLVDTDENLGNLNAMTKVSAGLEIPYDKTRDLKYFKYWKKYQFWKYTLQSAQTIANGVVAATVTLSDTVESKDYVLDTFAFNVQASVGIIPDSSLNYSQYQYLFSKITALENAENVFVPYTGADDNVDLGNHYLKTSSYINIQGALYNASIDSRGINITAEDYDFTLDFPVSTNQSETIATQEWVENQGYLTEHQSLAGYVPYTGATNNVNLGNHSLAANSIGIYNTYQNNTVYCGGFGSSGNGNLYIESEHAIILEAPAYYINSVSDNNKIATRKETKLYRHTIQIADQNYTNYYTLVVYMRTSNAVNTLDKLIDFFDGVDNYYFNEVCSLRLSNNAGFGTDAILMPNASLNATVLDFNYYLFNGNTGTAQIQIVRVTDAVVEVDWE